MSDRTLRKWMHDDGLPFLRIDGCVLIPCGQLEEWLAERVESEHRTEELVGEVLDGL
ncbi:MAG: helix-turn-helix domain-containing protein [bacterium]|nr:helix-turn-helix domain-containing protein [bacterium]